MFRHSNSTLSKWILSWYTRRSNGALSTWILSWYTRGGRLGERKTGQKGAKRNTRCCQNSVHRGSKIQRPPGLLGRGHARARGRGARRGAGWFSDGQAAARGPGQRGGSVPARRRFLWSGRPGLVHLALAGLLERLAHGTQALGEGGADRRGAEQQLVPAGMGVARARWTRLRLGRVGRGSLGRGRSTLGRDIAGLVAARAHLLTDV